MSLTFTAFGATAGLLGTMFGTLGGLIGSFILGLFFGVVSSPCATPVLVVIPTFVATKGKALYGVALIFTYAVGHCLLMLAAGTFTGFIESFIKTKGIVNFSACTRRICGAIITAACAWFIWQTF